jgi:hypothetical protein
VLTHLSIGFNGPSITAAWLVAILPTRPEVEAELIAEIDGITGGDPEYDHLASLRYTTQVIKEAVRVYPPMPITIRRSLKTACRPRDGLLRATTYPRPTPCQRPAGASTQRLSSAMLEPHPRYTSRHQHVTYLSAADPALCPRGAPR